MKNETAVTLKLSLNIVGTSNDTTNFLHKFLLNSERPKCVCGRVKFPKCVCLVTRLGKQLLVKQSLKIILDII